MKIIAIALALCIAAPALAADACPAPKRGPDLRPCKPPAVKVNGRCTIVKERVVVKEVTKEVVKTVPGPTVTVTKEVVKTVPVLTVQRVEVQKPSPWEVMAYAQFGAHLNHRGYPSALATQTQLNGELNNWATYGGGFEARYKPLRLGLRTSVGNTGIGALVQFFPYQGERLSWHVSAGGAFTGYPFYRPSAPAVQRYWDVQAGTGIEYAFTPHVIGLIDLKASLPIPWTNTDALRWGDVGDALSQTAALAGIGYRF